MKNKRLMNGMTAAISLVLLIGLWQIMSVGLSNSVLPSPALTLKTLSSDLVSGDMLPSLGITLFRVLKSFIYTMVIGVAIGCLLGLNSLSKSLFGYWIVIGSSIPPLVIIIVVFLGMGLNERAAVTAAVLTTIFTIVQNIEQGVKALDEKLVQMGESFQAPRLLMLRKIILPQIYPYIIASARFGLSITWKMVIFVEQMGRSDGVGFMINYWYQRYNMAHVLSYALVFILVMLLIEFLLNKLVEPVLFKWQPKKQ